MTRILTACAYTDATVCIPAVAITEFGSDCDTFNPSSSPRCANGEATHLQDIARYLTNAASIPSQFRSKNRNAVWFWWSWNANSGDTGGIVTGTGAPWYTVKWYKVRYLERLGLCPWFKSASSCVSGF